MGNKFNTEIIEKYRQKNNLSKTRFCKITKISPSTYEKIMNGDGKYSVKALFKIARVINVPEVDFFR